MDEAIVAGSLTKQYRNGVKALAGVTFHIKQGEIFGYLGRNGSGKTTTVRILTGLTKPTSGKAQVAGYNLPSEASYVRSHIGVTLQEAALDDMLTASEHLVFIGGLWGLASGQAKGRADELLQQFGLTQSADRRVGTFSGGMRRRLDIATALIMRPQILFLDEPTTGLDPQSRRALWGEIRALRDDGATVFLTTQYLEEADELADKIAILNRGSIEALGTAAELKERFGTTSIKVQLSDSADARRLRALVPDAAAVDEKGSELSITLGPKDSSWDVLGRLHSAEVPVVSVSVREPSLEDVFVKLTGEEVEQSGENAAGAAATPAGAGAGATA
ncbi:MAG TPA: ATP-binding cassette domain-containing protein [Acidimicrobiales bacterium]|jgi:daunorubicin resistance ABC transporter ATP-binding subunit|nr:ATP-binding cassette domain-containing protein [Acidimicrobiales bacterium]